MDRRLFLSGVALTFTVAAFGNSRPPRTRKEIYMAGYELKDGKKVKEVGMKIITNESVKTYPLKNEIHSVVYSPKHDIKVFIPKIDKTAYGWVKKGSLIPIAPAPGHAFYGHGAIDEKRDLLYTTQSAPLKDENVPGYIYVYSLPDFKLIDKFPSYGGGPHDISIIRDELIVCNGSANPNMAHIDLSTRKLIKSYPSPDKLTSLTHCTRIDDQTYAVASTARDLKKPAPLFRFTLGKGLEEFQTPSEIKKVLMQYQLLSVLSHSGHVFATCPTTGVIMAWTVAGQFIGVVPIRGASNLSISKNQNGVIVGSGEAGQGFWLANIEQGQLVAKPIDISPGHSDSSGSGAHAIIIS